MNILLCIAPWKHTETHTKSMSKKGLLGNKFGRIPGASPPLGLLYIASALKKEGHKVKFVDGIFSSEEEILDLIHLNIFDLVAFSVNEFL